MAKEILLESTNQTIDVFIQDSTATDGSGLTGLVYNSGDLDCYYRIGATGSWTQLTLVTQTIGGTHTDGGFVEGSATNAPGMYRLDLSDAMLASAGLLKIMLKDGPDMAPCVVEIEVVRVDKYDDVSFGLDTLDAPMSSRSSHSAADVWTSTTRTLSSFGTLVADIWDRLTSALTTSGSVGKLVVDNLDAQVSSRAEPLPAIINFIPTIPCSVDLADTAPWRMGFMITDAIGDLPTQAEITPGTVSLYRKALGGTTWVLIVDNEACDEEDGYIFYDEIFDSATGYAEGDSLRFIFRGQKVTIGGVDHELSSTGGKILSSSIRQTMITPAEINTEVDTALSDIKLDHLIAVAESDEAVDDSIIAKLATSIGDWSDFIPGVHSLQAIAESVGNIAIGSAAINDVADSFTKAGAEPETNTYLSTHELDGTYHIVEDDGGTTDAYYEFNIGGNGVPIEFGWSGYALGINDTYAIYAYNFVTASWDQIGTVAATVGTTIQSLNFTMTVSHVGSGTNLGKVRMRFLSTDGDTFATDRVLCSYAVVSQSVGYADGAVWVDTNGSNTNTEPYVDGTADNPVSTWAAALTLATSLGLKRFHIINGSTITLSANSDNYTLLGDNWILILNGQSIAGAYFSGAAVTGTATGSGYEFFKCTIADGNPVSLDDGLLLTCALASTASNRLTLTAAGTYYLDQCFSGVAGTDTPVIDFNTSASQNLNVRHYSGGIRIYNMGNTGTDKMSLEGHGQLQIDVSCLSGTIAVRGHFDITDEALGAVTISTDANFYSSIVHAGTAQAGTANTITLESTASVVDGAYDPAAIFIASGTGAGQTRLIYQYTGSSRVAVVDRNWKVTPDTTSQYRILAHPGREGVNEGIAQAGTANTITLNPQASASDNAYLNQLIFLRSGTGEDQVGVVEGYVGATKVATVTKNWIVNPDNTTGYVMLPNHVKTDAEDVSNVDDAISANSDIGDILDNTNRVDGLIEDVSGDRYTTKALEQAPSGGGGGDATEAKQDEILEDLADIKGTGFIKDTDSLTDLTHQAGAKGSDNINDNVEAVKLKTDDLTFTVANELDTNIKSINDDSDAAATLEKAIHATEYGIVGAGAHTTTSIAASDLTSLSNDAVKYGVINFTTGVNKGRSAPITAYVTGTGEITIDPSYPLVLAPSNGDEFTIT